MRTLTLLAMTTYSSIALGQADIDACSALLEHGINNVFYQSSEHASAIAAHRAYCDRSWEALSEEDRGAIGAFTAKVNVDISGSSSDSRTRFEEFCENFNYSQNDYGREVLRAQSLYDRAVEAWESCIRLNSGGVKVDPAIASDNRSVDLEIRSTQGNSSLRGVTAQNMSCYFRDEEVGPALDLELSADTISIRCNRHFEEIEFEQSRGQFYPSANVKISTNRGDFRVEFTEMFEGPARDAFARLESQIASLKQTQQKLKANLQRGISSSGSGSETAATLTAENGRVGDGRYHACPPGTYVSGVGATKSIGGGYGVDGISEITVHCKPVVSVMRE